MALAIDFLADADLPADADLLAAADFVAADFLAAVLLADADFLPAGLLTGRLRGYTAFGTGEPSEVHFLLVTLGQVGIYSKSPQNRLHR